MTLPTSPRSPPYSIVDPAIRASDHTIPNVNNAFVEYEVILKGLLEQSIPPASVKTPDTVSRDDKLTALSFSGARPSRATSLGPTTVSTHRTSPPQPSSVRSASIGPSTVHRDSGALKARQTNDAAAAAWDHGIEQMLNAAALGNYEGSAFSGDAHVSELLKFYLNGDLLFNMTVPNARDLRESIMALRRDHVFPMITASKAAYGALIAYMETTPGIPIQSENEFFVRWHLNLALSLVNVELADPEKLDGDAVILTIVLLMMISQRGDDLPTFRAHASGLMTLTARRQLASQEAHTRASTSPDTSPTYSEPFSDFPPASQSSLSPSYTGTLSPTAAVSPEPGSKSAQPSGNELQNLVAKELISEAFARSHQYALIINPIGTEARYDWILALALAQHLWTDGGAPTSLNPLEAAIHSATRLCLHLNVWPVTSRPCAVALRRVAAIRASLLADPRLDALFFAAPDALLWIALAAGPLAVGHARAWFVFVLRKARALAGVAHFADALALARARYAWTAAMTLAAHVFWVAAVHPGALDDARLADFDRRAGAGADDAAERAQCWMLAQRLKMEARVPPLRFCDGPWSRAPSPADLARAEDELVRAVQASASWEIESPAGTPGARPSRRRPVVWIPPSPPCLLGTKCGAHGGAGQF